MAIKKFLRAVKASEESRMERMEQHEERPENDESGWLVSYADMMTLLCGFFIMLFSMSHLEEPKFEQARESIAKTFGGDFKSPSKELAKFVTQVLTESGVEKDTTVRVDPSGVAISFQSTIFFDTLSSDVRPQGSEVLNKLLTSLMERQKAENKAYKIVVEGHTDSRPILSGVYPSNWELSGARAARVVRMFLDKGFSSDRMVAIGYADTRPEVPQRTPSGSYDDAALSKNRRVVIRILDPKVDSIPLPVSPSDIAGPMPAPAVAVPANTAH
jgi:chemotaxis protein MotB